MTLEVKSWPDQTQFIERAQPRPTYPAPDRFKEGMVVGCFLLLPLERGKWEVWNTLKGVLFCTYAMTVEEVVAEYTVQSEAWERKLFGKKGQGAAWRAGFETRNKKE